MRPPNYTLLMIWIPVLVIAVVVGYVKRENLHATEDSIRTKKIITNLIFARRPETLHPLENSFQILMISARQKNKAQTPLKQIVTRM